MISPEVSELLPAAPTFDSEREAEVEFTTCGFRAASGNFIEVIYIGDIDNKALVAVPFEVWHRNSPKRKLGAALARPVLVGLAACTAADRETLLEEVELRVWLGLMAKDIAAQLELVTDRSPLDYAFGVDGNRGFLPHVRALAGVAWEQFQFVSAESAADVEEEPQEDFGVPNGSGEMTMNPEELGPRVVALEDMLQQLSQNVSVLVNKLGVEPEVEKKPKRKSKFVAPTAKSAPSTPSVSKDRKSLGFAARYPSGCQCGECCIGRWCGARSLGGDGEADGVKSSWCKEVAGACSEEKGASGPCRAGPFRERGRRAIRRVWWCWGSSKSLGAELLGSADRDSWSSHCRASEKSQDLKGGSSSGWSYRSYFIGRSVRWKQQKGRCGQEGATSSPFGPSRRHQRFGGEVDAGGPHSPSSSSRSSFSYSQCESLGGTSFSSGTSQNCSLLLLVRSRDLRRLDSWKTCTCESEGSSVDPTAGSNSHRSRLLGLLLRTFFGAKSALCSSCESLSTCCWRWRESFLPSPRWEMGRDLPVAPQGHGGFPDKETSSGQEVGGSGEGQGEGESQGEGEGQSKGQLREQGDCMISEADGGAPTPDVQVPGLRAPTVYVPALVNSIGRLIGKHGGRLATFFKSFFTARPHSESQSSHSSCLWPMPLPYPEAFRCGESFSSNWRKRRACLQVLVLNWLCLGKPGACRASICLGQKLSGKQWRRVRLLEQLSEDSNSLFEIDASAMARAAAKTEAAADELESLHRALSSMNFAFFGHGSNSGGSINVSPFDVEHDGAFAFGFFEDEISTSSFVAAKEIEADRVVFSGEPKFNPLPYFDKETAFAYERPILHSQGFEPEAPPPRVQIHASVGERNKLFRKMALTGRLSFVSAADARLGLLSGLFCVPKDLDRDRLILDARPPNSAEPGLSRWTKTMSSAACLFQIVLRDDEQLRMSGRDIKDYFYQFSVSEERCRRNVLASYLSAADLQYIFDRPFDCGGYVGLSTLAMGDISACEYAQCAHLGILLQSGACQPDELLQLHRPAPRQHIFIGLVIDDLVCLERIAAKLCVEGGPSRSRLDERMDLVMKEYNRAQLPTNEKKSFNNESKASFWGIQLDGTAGLVRANDVRFWPLVLITVRIACLGVSTVRLLQSVAGSWISVLCVRRRLMSLMNLIFDAIACSTSGNQVLRLSRSLIDELFSYCICGSLSVVNLRASVPGLIRATDASNWGMAAVGCQLSDPVCHEALRLSLSRSVWSKLLPPRKAWLREKNLLDASEELPSELQFDTHPFWEALGRCYAYRELWRKQRPRRIHINVGEIRAVLIEEKRLANNYASIRVPFALDSQVALGALVKGRASSKALNSELEKSLCYHIGSDMYPCYGFWPSKLNRADGPTRHAEVPPPDMEKPPWLLALEQQDFAAFDEWVKSVEKETFPTTTAYKELGYKDGVDLRPRSQLRMKEDKVEKKSYGALGTRGIFFGSSVPEEVVNVLKSFKPEQFRFPGDSIIDGPGALDLYAGVGGVGRALIAGGCPWVLSFEILRGSDENLLDAGLQRSLLLLISLKAFDLVGSAIVCRSFSIAVTPPVRSPQFPRGVPWMSRNMKEKVREGNQMADFQSLLHEDCEIYDVFYWTENPDGSHLWRQRKFKKYKEPTSRHIGRFDMCRFGTSWRKRTRVASNIPGILMFCKCGAQRSHTPLRGQHPTLKRPWTSVAQAYPRGFAKFIADAALDACGWKSGGRLDVAGCSRSQSLRIGEASNPGPRGGRAARNFSLEDHPVQTAASLHLGNRRWDEFEKWARKSLKLREPLDVFLQVPILLAHAIRRFGDLDFCNDGSLSYYRHLVLAALRRVPTLRPYVGICWDLATRWSCMEPTEHRTPIPEPLMKALCSLAWMNNWQRWCGVLLLSFYGVARVGEVLHCRRSDLLLPSDRLNETVEDSAYLLLQRSKTMHRQAARIQHLKIESKTAVRLLNYIFKDCDKDSMLYEGSSGVFRKRWDFLLSQLGVDSSLHVTPGGLRGGGAVECYRRGLPIADLVWRMRLKQISTLESYLQEVAAMSLLTDLTPQSRRSIKSASSLFEFLATR